jgi:S-adenosylmethionine:tRNA ribosyltransferase-isomerase
MPLPPYIASKRPTDARDASDYQTMFAEQPGAVAAPTAALHFTPGLIAALEEAGVGHATLTLHVGAGTFLPVKADDTQDHRMHAEWGRIDAATAERLNAVRAAGGRIIAVGTTSLRLIESAVDEQGCIQPFDGDTAIFITPGYRFRGIDGLMTNFHLPKSTLFMLVSALMGRERMQAAYAHAIAEGYRFYSYGDGSLLLPDVGQGGVKDCNRTVSSFGSYHTASNGSTASYAPSAGFPATFAPRRSRKACLTISACCSIP